MKFSSNSTVQDILNQFNERFPFLRLEFYHHAHGDNAGSSIKDQVAHNTSLKALSPDINEAEVEIHDEMTVSEFEKIIFNQFNLNVQIFRKSSDLWLQTTATDHWTLAKQNGKGQRSGEEHNIEPIDITDFDVE